MTIDADTPLSSPEGHAFATIVASLSVAAAERGGRDFYDRALPHCKVAFNAGLREGEKKSWAKESYVPQDIAAECLERLSQALGGPPEGQANTLWAMVNEVCSRMEAMRAERDAAVEIARKALESIVAIAPGP